MEGAPSSGSHPRDHLNERVNLFPSCGRELLVARSERQLEDAPATQLYSPTRQGQPQDALKERDQVGVEGSVICEFTHVGPANEGVSPALLVLAIASLRAEFLPASRRRL